MKIVGVGLNKTGTSTLGDCLRHYGYKHISYDFTAFDQYLAGDLDALMATVDAYDSFEDWPWPLVYQEIDARYPDAKFILTKRRSAEKWFKSKCKLAVTLGPVAKYEAHVYGYEMPHGHKEAHIQVYEAHNRAVADYFKDRPEKLLTVCWEEGDGWPELAAFLGREVPDRPLPHANPSNIFHYTGENPTLARLNRQLFRNPVYHFVTKRINRLYQKVRRKRKLLRDA